MGESADADGWVAVGSGHTLGDWDLFAQFDTDEGWTGCLRLDHVDATVERCSEPGGAVVFGSSVAGFGAAPADVDLALADGRPIETFDGDLDVGLQFFVTTGSVVDAATGDELPVVGSTSTLDDLAASFTGAWERDGAVDCTDPLDGPGGSLGGPAVATVSLDGPDLVLTTPCGAPDAAPTTCSGSYVLVGATTEGDEVRATLQPSGVRCDRDGVTVPAMALVRHGDGLTVDGAPFRRTS